MQDIPVKRVAASRIGDVDFDNLGFGGTYSDHMFQMIYEDGAWGQPEILPYGPIPMEPGCATLHYGQSVFEGLKAFRGADDVVRVFRPEGNWGRLTRSCERLCIPTPPEEMFFAAIDQLVALDNAWIPRKRGQALYLRPLIFGDEPFLEVRPANRYRFIVMTAPVRAYFDDSMPAVSLKAEDQYTRAAPGGLGAAKTAANYAASLWPFEKAKQEGFMQVLWLDGIEHKYVEEVGAMNIFFKVDGKIITPELRGTILPGVTRDSVLTLLREGGHEVIEKRLPIAELEEAASQGRLDEAFGAGTAAIISPVGSITHKGKEMRVTANDAGPVTRWLYDQVTGIQLGEIEDSRGWCRVIGTGA